MPSIPLSEAPDINAQDSMEEELRFTYPTPELKREVEELELRGPTAPSSSATAEEAHRLHEENAASVREFKFENQEGLDHVRLGTPLGDHSFLGRLRHIVPARFTNFSRPGLWRMECLRPTAQGGSWEFATGVQGGMIPEFSTLYFTSHDLPTSEQYRGWRTVLLTLIQKGFITEEQATKEFGAGSGPESWRYRRTLFEFRNRGI